MTNYYYKKDYYYPDYYYNHKKYDHDKKNYYKRDTVADYYKGYDDYYYKKDVDFFLVLFTRTLKINSSSEIHIFNRKF